MKTTSSIAYVSLIVCLAPNAQAAASEAVAVASIGQGVEGIGNSALGQLGIQQAKTKYGTDFSMPPMGLRALVGWMTPPLRVTRTTLRKWMSDIPLSEGQQLAIDAYYDRFIESDAELRERLLKPIWEQAEIDATEFKEAAKLGGDIHAERDLRLAKLSESCDRALRSIRRTEDELFVDIERVLSDQQLEQFEAVRLRRTRRAKNIYSGNERATGSSVIDLSENVGQLRRLDAESVADLPALRATMLEYEQQLTQLYIRRHKWWRKWYLEGLELRAASRLRTPDGGRPDRRYIEWDLEKRRVDFDIGRLNDTYVDLLADHLSQEYARQFIEYYRQRAYGTVYPNPYSIAELIKAIGHLDDVTDDQLREIDGIAAETTLMQEETSRRMARTISAFHEKALADSGPFPIADRQRIAERVADWDARRMRTADNAILQLCDVLGEARASDVRLDIELLHKNWQRYEPFHRDPGKFLTKSISRSASPRTFRRIGVDR